MHAGLNELFFFSISPVQGKDEELGELENKCD